jgi:hypothetical protein
MCIVDENNEELPWDGEGIRRTESARSMGCQGLLWSI